MEQFEKGGHHLYHGDAIDVLQQAIPDGTIDLIFLDPPYNIGKSFNGRRDKWPSEKLYLDWCYQWLQLCVSKLKTSGALYLMASTQTMPFLDIFLRERLHILSRIIWSYDSSGVQARKYYGSLYEPILYAVKDPKNYVFNAADVMVEAKTGAQRKLVDYRKTVPTVYNSKKVPGNVWEIPRVRYRMAEYENHPTQKPVTLVERIILASSNVGDVVLDPFAGTFTTGYVAQYHQRRSISIEIEEPYFKIGLRRMGICDTYKGEPLMPTLRSYEQAKLGQQRLFEREPK